VEGATALIAPGKGILNLASASPLQRLCLMACSVLVCSFIVCGMPLHCRAADFGEVQRLPPVDDPSAAVDWDRETAAMVQRNVAEHNAMRYNTASMQPQQQSQNRWDQTPHSWTRARMGSPPASGQRAAQNYTAQIGEGPAWLGEMAPYVLTGDREGVGFNGLLEVDGIYDSNAVGLIPNKGVLREFVTSQIPVTGTQAATRYPREVISPNQTQLGVWFEQPTELARFRAYTLMNLFKDPYTVDFQVYKVYANYGWFKAGKDYTIFFNQSAAPDTIDFEGPNAIPYIRTPQLVMNIPLEELGFRSNQGLVVGIEHMPAELTLLNNADANRMPTVDAAVNWGPVNELPSFVGKYVYTPEGAHIEAAGLFRKLTAAGPNYRSSCYGYGMALSGKIATWGKNNVILAAQGGQGIAAYSQDSSGLGLDAAPSLFIPGTNPQPSTRGSLRPIPVWGAWAAYQHFWTETVRSTGTFSILTLNDEFVSRGLTPSVDVDDPGNTMYGRLLQARYASINVVWSPNPTFTLGIEYMYGHRFITGDSVPAGATSNAGQANRFQACVRWNFDHKTSFRN